MARFMMACILQKRAAKSRHRLADKKIEPGGPVVLCARWLAEHLLSLFLIPSLGGLSQEVVVGPATTLHGSGVLPDQKAGLLRRFVKELGLRKRT